MQSNRLKHPSCECSDLDPMTEEGQTLALSMVISQTAAVNMMQLGICGRQAYVAMVLAMVNSMDSYEWTDEEIRKEIGQCVDVALAVRKELEAEDKRSMN